eukprot:CAMPEP_0182500696 /NCGR_PEP_ID=MMETSP1321-20130603/9724_1 /TAXON_ID=91990 /ORGANISM="Bolidomonas sp., Strain RCC1657" /LENGTH=79 /DNA_ID=CAMNT_0024705201 /DNA_START=370 /DNA_END=609 /DNA_ORIENTATION=-
MVQPRGFSPVCVLWWVCKSAFLKNFLLQTVQEKGLIPLWVCMCRLILLLRVNFLSQPSNVQWWNSTTAAAVLAGTDEVT